MRRLVRFLLLLPLLFAPALYAGGVTIDPENGATGSSGTGSTDGSASGGYPIGDPWGSLYNPSLGTGILADPFAPTFAQQSGLNGNQTALGYGPGTTTAGDPVNMVTGNLIHSESWKPSTCGGTGRRPQVV